MNRNLKRELNKARQARDLLLSIRQSSSELEAAQKAAQSLCERLADKPTAAERRAHI